MIQNHRRLGKWGILNSDDGGGDSRGDGSRGGILKDKIKMDNNC